MEAFPLKWLLDTHAVIWMLLDDPRLGKDARNEIEHAEAGDLVISDMTLLEISMLVEKNKLLIQGSLIAYLTDIAAQFQVLPIDTLIAVEAMSLKLPQGDPFDRVIVATARRHNLTLITKDRHITCSKQVATLW